MIFFNLVKVIIIIVGPHLQLLKKTHAKPCRGTYIDQIKTVIIVTVKKQSHDCPII
jgi:hypothetical protein